ncbi:histidine kinase [Nonomuraea sp. NPDC050643]|uniref:sensor histidine kinase n=1 Tax=Nonomuraea sp. NPDC050643 TaxID=3155660 RepID=UPI0033C47BA4
MSSLTVRLRPVAGWWRRDVPVRDSVTTALFVGLAFLPGLSDKGIDLAEWPRRPSDAVGVLLLLAQCLPLAVRTRWPAVCLALVAGAFVAHELLRYPLTFASIALLLALYSVGAHQERHRGLVAGAATAAYAVFALVLHAEGSPETPEEYVTFFFVLAACWLAGTWIRTRATREAERARLAEAAVIADERARIAGELHDVVTHHVTAMVVQADAAGFLVTDAPDQVAAGLASISGTGRQALAELRYLLGVLDDRGGESAGGPVRDPIAGGLAELVARARSAGQPVELVEDGAPRPMTGAAELAAYRVVQEALTNALKHALGRRTVVRIRHDRDEVDIEVSTEGPPATPAPAGAGRGLTGLRERVSVVGGDLRAGGSPDGGFTVRARIPRSRS